MHPTTTVLHCVASLGGSQSVNHLVSQNERFSFQFRLGGGATGTTCEPAGRLIVLRTVNCLLLKKRSDLTKNISISSIIPQSQLSLEQSVILSQLHVKLKEDSLAPSSLRVHLTLRTAAATQWG